MEGQCWIYCWSMGQDEGWGLDVRNGLWEGYWCISGSGDGDGDGSVGRVVGLLYGQGVVEWVDGDFWILN